MAAIIAVKRSLLLLAEERISARQKERLRVEPRLLSLYGLMIALFFPSFLSLFLSLFRFFLLSFLALSFLPSLLFDPSSFHFFLSNEEETESLSIEFTWERMLELGMNRDRRWAIFFERPKYRQSNFVSIVVSLVIDRRKPTTRMIVIPDNEER